jgi:tetratricopeptide (TPR) repeat protein
MQARRTGPANEAELFEVLTGISRAGGAMSLVVCDGISERIFRFTPRNVTILRSGPRRSGTIGSVLVDSGHLDGDRLTDILRQCKETGVRFGDCAVSMEFVTREDIEQAIRTKVEEEILDLFFWPGAQYVLFDGDPPATYREGRYHAASHTCELTPLLDDLLHRVAERRTFVGRLPTGREVFVLDDFADLSDLRGEVADLLGEFDGTRIVTDVIEASGLRRCPAWQAVLSAEQGGLVRRLDSADARPVVEAAIAREIETLEAVLDRAVDASVVRVRLARACEDAVQLPRAASHWRHAGDECRARGDQAGAVACYEHCVRLAPTDFASREKILDIHHQRREFNAVVAQGRPLADMLVQHNLLNRAKRLLLQLVAIEPKNPALRQQLVMVLTGIGEQVLALHHLRELGAILEQRGAPDEQVLDVYLRILAVEPGNAKAKLSIDRLTGVAAQRRTTWATAVATITGLALCGGAFLYEASARQEIAFGLDAVEKKLAVADFGGARDDLAAAVAGHSLSAAAWQARDVVAGIEELEKAATRDPDGGTADAQTRALREREERAEQAQATIDAHIVAGRLDEAHRAVGYLISDYRHTKSIRRG